MYIIGLTCEWIDVSGKKLEPLITGDPEAVTVSNLNECKQKCVEESSFICAALNYQHNGRRCELLEENDQTAQPQGNKPDWKYSLRPICAGKFSKVSRLVFEDSYIFSPYRSLPLQRKFNVRTDSTYHLPDLFADHRMAPLH